MFHKIGLFVVLAAAFLVTVLTMAVAATPIVLLLEKLYRPALSVQQGPQQGPPTDALLANGEARWYQPRDSNGKPSVQADGKPLLFDSCTFRDLQGKPVINTNCPIGTIDHPRPDNSEQATDEFAVYKVNETKSLLTVPHMTVEFPAGMSDDEIRNKLLADATFRSSLKVDHYCPENEPPFAGCITNEKEPWKKYAGSK